jgi:hypothetical protein
VTHSAQREHGLHARTRKAAHDRRASPAQGPRGEPEGAPALLQKSPPHHMVSHDHAMYYSHNQRFSDKTLLTTHLRIEEVPDAPALAGAAPGSTGWPRQPPRVPTGLASRPTSIYGPSTYARRRYESSGAYEDCGHGERPHAAVARPSRPP